MWECYAFTHPDFRRKGYFSALLEQVCQYSEALGEPELCLVTDNKCPAATAALRELGAELWNEEYMMEYNTAADSSKDGKSASHASLPNRASDGADGRKQDMELDMDIRPTLEGLLICARRPGDHPSPDKDGITSQDRDDITARNKAHSTARSKVHSTAQDNTSGTDSTPDTFIAGEQGAELITNAKNRSVFTAAQTGSIFRNLADTVNAIRTAGAAPYQLAYAGAPSVAAPTLNAGGGRTSVVIHSAPVFHAGNDAQAQDIEEMLRRHDEELLDEIDERERQRQDDERRRNYD